ncbi:MAG TPA: M20/M25/M40 family metallo-hydrolase [Candidatus Acidoferrales bacterium]|nr:M20/M25/M40 family metallo-hydrolase [Candidatus Acidoferrales bacterium]
MRLVWTLCLALFSLSAADLTERYRQTADRLIDAALADSEGYNRLAYLCYRIGPRLSGSPGLEKAIAWSVEQMKAAGLSNVRTIPAKVPHWERGRESATMVAPYEKPLHMLGLGMSIGTASGGITADVVTVNTFDDLAKLGREKIQGKIVLYNEEYRGYGPTRVYRSSGASRAAAYGAVAALVRSATPLAMQIPHTGEMNYDESQPKIPAAAVSPEDAMMMAWLTAGGVPVKVHLEMQARSLPDADSADVIGEIPGREHPEEVVVMGGHIDSWDVGQGAQDDGASIVACLQAVALMKKLGLQPRRTIRVAFWVNEENGGRGGAAYREFVGTQIKNQAAAIEMDGGAEAPRGFGASVDAASMDLLQQIGKLLDRVNAGEITAGGGGSDIGPLMRDGVPGLGERTVGTHYFDWHHTEADTLDKVNPEDFRKNVAALAVMGYVLADMPGRLVAGAGGGRRAQ